MGPLVFGIITGILFATGLLAFIDLISNDNGRGYQPNKPLNGSPPNKGNCIQRLPDDKRQHKAPLMIQTGDFRRPERIIGIVYGEDAALWHAYIFKSCCGAEYFEDNGELAGVVILSKEAEQ